MRWLTFLSLSLGWVGTWVSTAIAAVCPFCASVSQTFTEEMASMDVVVFAELQQGADPPKDLSDPASVTRALFKITSILKGGDAVSIGDTLETVYFGDAKPGDRFLVQGIRPPDIAWSTPMRISERAQQYLTKLDSIPTEGADRLRFFQDYLEDSDETLARDAYDEFAIAPYKAVQDLKDSMQRDKLIGWLKNPDVSASRKRLYFTMLGVCGSDADLPLLEEFMRSTDRRQKAGLDALIACYLTIRGSEGLPVINELFLANHEADYSDTYAAITALRFHGTDGDRVPKEELVKSLGLMLDRPTLADLVIPDLARWEDWTVMERLVELFKNADEKTSWVRVPVVNYLRACPLPEAKAHLEELTKIDPDSIRRANTFFPVLDDDDLEEEEKEQGAEGGTVSPGTEPVEADKSETDKSVDSVSDQRESNSIQTISGLAMSLTSAATGIVSIPQSVDSASTSQQGRRLQAARPVNVQLSPLVETQETDGAHLNRSESSHVESSGAWSDSSRFVASKPGDVASANQRAETQLLGTTDQAPRTILMLFGSLLAFALLVVVQWSVLTGRMARFVN